jgi:hypothetical protein
MLTNITGLSKKSSTRLSNFQKKVRQGYRSFQKMFAKVTGLFGKNEGSKYTSPRRIVSGTLPDFPKKAGEVIELF